MLKEPRIENKRHRRFVASLPCCACGLQGRSQAAHIRTGNNAGASYKSGDDCTVPLCTLPFDGKKFVNGCHEIQGKGERKFWEPFGGSERATDLANNLYSVSGNYEAAFDLLAGFR